ncbi:hypothetical protein Gogos_000497 [Gossypium gossypioides]|uniref:ABC transporter domain-containing protein n=1 Tax=Gossypium gossypioides TaxID=34282 RepID=A0A7J9CT08_GOSGO|nr:hypothetical protein [Gossypium gossypioides]
MFFMQMPEVFMQARFRSNEMCLHIVGEILIDNYNIKDLDLKLLRKNIGVVSQEPSLFTGTINDNIKVGNMDASDQQNQQIAIAKAILKNPPILLLYEATSALDSESEKLVQDALEKATQGRTVILIAHRMSTIINVDIIAVVENGQVTETGTNCSLLDSSKFYKNLFSIQNIGQICELRATEFIKEFLTTNKQFSPLDIKEEETRYRKKNHSESSSKGKKMRINTNTFFRIWFGLGKRELAKIATDSITAAFAGVSKHAVMPCHFIGGLIQAKSAKRFVGDSTATHREVVALVSESFEDGIRSYQIFSLTVPSITKLWMLIPVVISAINVLTPAFETLDRKTEIEPDAPQDTQLKMIKGKIEFQNVEFNCPLRPEVTVLNNFSLQIETGTKVALVGPSGAGKSSVLAILLRFYDPNQGRVLIDETNINEYNLKTLTKQIGLVQQEALLFSSTLRVNICYGAEQASEAKIVEVSTEANIHEFISNLLDGYNTLVGDKGCQLSGGQKQRVAIARTLLKRPEILLLGEATSALDAESERTVVNALELIDRRKGNCGRFISNPTQIIVAHRLSIVVNSDVIVVMDKGEILETGSHSTLISTSDGVYSRLFHIQNEI